MQYFSEVKMKKIYFAILVFISFQMLSAAEKPEDFQLVKKVTDGTLNYSTFELVVTGYGVAGMNVTNLNSARINAEKAALANAVQKTVEILSSLPLSGKTTAWAYFKEKNMPDFVAKLVNPGDFKEISGERFYSNSSVDATYKVNVADYIRKIADEASRNAETVPGNAAESADEAGKTKTVLVVRVKNAKFEPSLLMSLADEKKNKIYDISMSSTRRKSAASVFFAVKKWDAVAEKAGISGEVLAVQALKINNGSEIILKNSDADKIRAELKKECFEEGKIVLVSE